MKLVEVNWNPTNRQLRQFGLICLFALPLISWLWGGGSQVVIGLGAIGLGLALAGAVFPAILKPVFLALTIVTTPIGVVLGEAAMLSIYFGVFLPIGLVFRLMGRDGLQLKRDPEASTYWQSKTPPRDVASYYRQS